MSMTTGSDEVALVVKTHQLQIKQWTHQNAAI
jgi:hypothetical protein